MSQLRAVVWLVLVVALTGGGVASGVGLPVVVNLAFGALSAGCVAALVSRHLRVRRSRAGRSS